jgi:5,5'-dehydrodivanillate O-demethylase oxygenase subunit
MLSVEDNILLTQTGKGTPMGELLRRHWHPIAAATEFEDKSTKQVRLLSEDLVLYKDRSGTFGLLALHCAHRRADLSYGFVEECGLRCSYHGWAFDEAGNCLSAPFEDSSSGNSRFRDQIKQPAYPVQEMAGLIFAYLGPQPTPVLPRWELFDYKNGFAQIVLAPLDCNWMQAAENDIDPVHFEWLHNNWSRKQVDPDAPPAPKHVLIDVEEYDYGFGYKRILENTTEEDTIWTQPRLHLMPNIFMPGGTHFEYRVPIDDTHTLSLVWAWTAVPLEQQPYVQARVPHWQAKITDPVTGRWISSHVINQDTIAWIGQGVLSDRQNEHLGRSDIGVIKYRNRLREDLEKVANGEDPSGVFRDPEANTLVRWPDNRRERIEPGKPKADLLKQLANFASPLRAKNDYFNFYAGQPEDVAKAYEEAMGI